MSESNRFKHPDAWVFYEEQARNIMGEPDLVHLGNYRIPAPDETGNFIYADTPEQLWARFFDAWTFSIHDSESLHRQIQYIVTHLNH
jgi:hypothetical protein